jgi:HEAT repeat protein
MCKCPSAIVLIVLVTGCGRTLPPDGQPEKTTVVADAQADPRKLLECLNSADPLQRAYGVRLLGETQQSADSTVPHLLSALKDPSHLVRSRAAEALGKVGDNRAVMPLIDVLNDAAEDPDVLSRAAEALGRLRAGEAVEPLMDLLTNMVWYVRYQAVVALGRIGEPAARGALAQAIRYDPDFSVRAAARQSLQQLDGGARGHDRGALSEATKAGS